MIDICDQHLSSEGENSDKYEELDAAALLWRLNLLGVDVGDRWRYLADRWEPAAQDTLYAFNDVHAMMTFVSDNRTKAQQDLLTANENYDDCTERLIPVRYMTHRLGGGFAQRDIIGWTLLE